MLFSSTNSDKIRDHLIKITEAVVFCMHVLEVPNVPAGTKIKASHTALYDAMSHIIDLDVANNFEFGFMLDQASRKLRPLISEDSLSM